MEEVYDNKKLSSLLKINDDFYLDPSVQFGKGSYGEVYKGYCKSRNIIVAIKTIVNEEGYQRQIQTLKALSSLIHPNIMGYFGFQKSKDQIYIFMQCCPNGNLTDLINKGLTEIQVLKLFRQLVEGMCYMNAKGKMHRDLKPDNILIGVENDIKISDFGLARETNSIFVTGKLGTPLYAGPQVYLNQYEQNYSEKCDVWSAGMILYQMLTGKLLFQGVKTYEDLKKEWLLYEKGEKRVQYGHQFHPNWEYFTNYMLTFDEKKRPTFHEILQKLKKVYERMNKQISINGSRQYNQNTKVGKLQKFLSFQSQKYQILLKICNNFTQKDIAIRNECKYISMFLCLSHYLCHIKKLTRNLKYKRLKVNDEDDQDLIEEDNPDFDMTVDKYRNFFEHKYNYYSEQIRNNIIPKILDDYCKREDSKAIMKEFTDICDLAIQVKDGTFDVEQTYVEAFKTVAKTKLQHCHKDLSTFSEDQLKIYTIILIGASLDQCFPNDFFVKKQCIKGILDQINTRDREKLTAGINKLKTSIK